MEDVGMLRSAPRRRPGFKSHNKLTLKLTNLYFDRANLTLKLFASPNHVCAGAVPAGGDNDDSMNTV